MSRQAIPDEVDFYVLTAAELTSEVDDLRLADGTRAWVRGPGPQHGLWCLDQTSADPIGPGVVPTQSGAGRWMFFGGGVGGGGPSPWVSVGGVIREVVLTDAVAMGAAAMVAGERLRVVGDALVEGSGRFEAPVLGSLSVLVHNQQPGPGPSEAALQIISDVSVFSSWTLFTGSAGFGQDVRDLYLRCPPSGVGFLFSKDGFLGIGTVTPTVPLHVVGDAIVTGKLTVGGVIDPTALILSGGAGDEYVQSDDGSTAAIAPVGKGRVRYSNGPVKRWEFSSNGKGYLAGVEENGEFQTAQGVRFSSPAILFASGPGEAVLDYDTAIQRLVLSENAGPFRPVATTNLVKPETYRFSDAGVVAIPTTYLRNGTGVATAVEAATQIPASETAFYDYIQVDLLAPPGVGESVTYRVRLNGADTGLFVTISGAATTANASPISLAVTQGDMISISQTPTAGAVSSEARVTVRGLI